jgi:hypothetical protein
MAAASPSGNRLTAKYMATGSTPPITPATGSQVTSEHSTEKEKERG